MNKMRGLTSSVIGPRVVGSLLALAATSAPNHATAASPSAASPTLPAPPTAQPMAKTSVLSAHYYYAQGKPIPLRVAEGRWAMTRPAHDNLLRAQFEAENLQPVARLASPHGQTEILEAGRTRIAGLPWALRRRAQPIYLDVNGPLVPSDRICLRFHDDVSAEDRKRALHPYGGQVLEALFPDTWVVRVEGDSVGVANELQESGLTHFAEPDLSRPYSLRAAPSDPFFSSQWHLHNTGQSGALPGADINLPEALDTTSGSPEAIIAIVDTGVDPSHEDLDPCKLLPGYDAAMDAPGEGDWNGHGTACSGVAAARANNARGVAGACPACRILPIRIALGLDVIDLGSLGSPNALLFTFDTHIARATHHAVDSGAWVISNSWGPVVSLGPAPLSSLGATALDYAATQGREGRGAVVLFAAGNEAAPVELDGWASHPTVMAVGATNDQDRRSSYSNYGTTLSISAPSSGIGNEDGAQTTGIWTTDIMGAPGYNGPSGLRPRMGDALGNYTARFGGTSSATPLAAGVAGLVLSVNRSLTAPQVRAILEQTAVKVDPSGGQYDTNGLSPYYGHGRLDAAAAVSRALADRSSPLTGDACASGCSGSNPDCRADPTFGDYCTHSCIGNTDCPAGFECAPNPGGSGSVCTRPAPCPTPPELCNGTDDNGNGQIDEGCEPNCGAETFEGRCVPPEGLCLGNKAVQCRHGYRIETECETSCGMIVQNKQLQAGCLCEGMSSSVECDGEDVVFCLGSGEVLRIPCSEIEEGSNRCVATPGEKSPIECVVGSSPDAGADAVPNPGASASGSATDDEGCDCMMAGRPGREPWRQLSPWLVALAMWFRRRRAPLV